LLTLKNSRKNVDMDIAKNRFQKTHVISQRVQDEGLQTLKNSRKNVDVGVLGLLDVGGLSPGRVAVFTDSSCVDNKEVYPHPTPQTPRPTPRTTTLA